MPAAAALVAVPTLASMARSTSINAWIEVDRLVSAAVRERAERERLLRKGAPSLGNVPFLEVAGGPPIAMHLGRPYRGLTERRNGPAREPSLDAVLVVSTREKSAQNLIPSQTARRGLPRFFANPARVAVFAAAGPNASRSVVIEPQASDVAGIEWTHAAVEPTLDGEAFVCAVAMRHGQETLFASPGGTISMTIHPRGDQPPVTRTLPLETQSARNKRRLVAWVQWAPRDAADWARVDVVVTAPGGQQMRAVLRRGEQSPDSTRDAGTPAR
jgi:hypothetical protein